ncbi:MAG: hypothetical protein AB7W16_21140 [Candidatus Obscuribacterales bacterium]
MARIHAGSRLGDYFVAFRLATRQTIRGVQQDVSANQLFGQALVKAGVCDRELCEEIAGVQRHYKRTSAALSKRGITIVLDEKTMIGDILVALGFITPESKQECLDYQAARRARGEDAGRLGELLVDTGVCTAAERDMAMKVQNWLRGVK